jgi:hypothetical protein
MPSLSLNVGLNNGRKLPFGGGAAPSGIPVAGTTEIVVTSSNEFIPSGTYSLNGDRRFEDVSGDNRLQFSPAPDRWDFISFSDIASTTGSPDYIPFSGYTIIFGTGSITVAAA